MNFKKLLFNFTLIAGLTILMSTTCKKDEPNDPSGNCDGYASANASGQISTSLCFNALVSYQYTADESLSFVARQDGDPTYSINIQMTSGNGAFNGPGTYSCGFDAPGYVELDIHGSDDEFYKAQSGTITITTVDNTHFNATFNVVTVGYYNEKTVNLSGTVKK
jgi:hypothetical protein